MPCYIVVQLLKVKSLKTVFHNVSGRFCLFSLSSLTVNLFSYKTCRIQMLVLHALSNSVFGIPFLVCPICIKAVFIRAHLKLLKCILLTILVLPVQNWEDTL